MLIPDGGGQRNIQAGDRLNKVMFGDTIYLVYPLAMLGPFANGQESPQFDIYPGEVSYSEASKLRDGHLLRFYQSSIPEPEAILATFPMIQVS